MLSSSLDALLKVTKMISPQNYSIMPISVDKPRRPHVCIVSLDLCKSFVS